LEAELTSTINCIINPTEFFNSSLNYTFNLRFFLHIDLSYQDFHIIGDFFYVFFCFVEAGEVDVADGDLAAAFEGKGDSCCSADPWFRLILPYL
jgi:hypothetical protein